MERGRGGGVGEWEDRAGAQGSTGRSVLATVGLRADSAERRRGRPEQAPPYECEEAVRTLVGAEGLEGEVDQRLDVGVGIGVGEMLGGGGAVGGGGLVFAT